MSRLSRAPWRTAAPCPFSLSRFCAGLMRARCSRRRRRSWARSPGASACWALRHWSCARSRSTPFPRRSRLSRSSPADVRARRAISRRSASRAIFTFPRRASFRAFLKEGARKFIFEGGECGGHTGPRSSFVLWEIRDRVLAEAKIDDPRAVQILFAGGVHDALSAAMVARLAAPLAARGMKIGVLMGTAYLFTREAVSAGAILRGIPESGAALRGYGASAIWRRHLHALRRDALLRRVR